MYFSSKIEIDPTQVTVIKAINQSSVFQTLFTGLIDNDKKYEQETFSAMTILDQIHQGLQELNIKNTIRLAVDNVNYFIDYNSEDDDLHKAIFAVRKYVDPEGAKYFDNIFLVQEHHDENFKYIIEIRIKRIHKVKEYPIKIHINALYNEFKLSEEDYENLNIKLGEIFESQESYNEFIKKKKTAYDIFVKSLFKTLGKKISVDGIKSSTDMRIIRPFKQINNINGIKFSKKAHSIFYGYPNIINHFYYVWKWVDFCYKNRIKLVNTKIVDEIGFKVMSISDIGVITSDYKTFDTNFEFEPFQSSFVRYYKKNQYNDKLLCSVIQTEDYKEDFYGESYGWLKSDVPSSEMKMKIVSTRRNY